MARFLITGASGYIGSMLTKHLLREYYDAKVVGIVRNMEKARQILPSGVEIVAADVSDKAALESALWKMDEKSGEFGSPLFDYVIHCAAVTKSAEMISRPVEVSRGIIEGTQNILELARRGNVRGVVYLSSMEIYGNIVCPEGQLVTEEDAARGEIDILNTRSCYPLGKRMAENLCFSYYKEYGLPVKIARLAQVFGQGVPRTDTRVFAGFARAVEEGRDIILHTDGSSMGNYCAIEDAVSGILKILEHGKNGEAYNVVNEECTMTIREMAELVCAEFSNGKSRVVFDIPGENVYGYAAHTGLRLGAKKLRGLGWQPTKGLKEMYGDMLHPIASL